MEQGERILTVGEAAAICGLSRSTLRRAVIQGILRAWRTPGGHLRFQESDCLDFAAAMGRVDIEIIGHRYQSRDRRAPRVQLVKGRMADDDEGA